MLQAGAHARARTRRRELCGGGGGDANLAARGQALAGVKILQDVQEELAQKPVLLRGEKEGLVRIIFGLEAVLRQNRILDTYFPAGPSGALISSFYDNMP